MLARKHVRVFVSEGMIPAADGGVETLRRFPPSAQVNHLITGLQMAAPTPVPPLGLFWLPDLHIIARGNPL